MGCDIHTMAEVLVTPRKWDPDLKTHVNQPPKWKAVKRDIFTNPYYWPTQEVKPFGKYALNIPYCPEPYRGRDYELFSVLADVRNHNPRANIFDPSMRYEMRDAILPIEMPRGIPEDASKAWAKYADDGDLHSHSYFTLTELLKAIEDGAFSQKFENGGYISADAYRALKRDGTRPTSWAGYASNGIQEADFLAMTQAEQDAYTGWITARWPDELQFEWFLKTTIPELTRLAPFIGELDRDALREGKPDVRKRDTDKVRFVFAFDN